MHGVMHWVQQMARINACIGSTVYLTFDHLLCLQLCRILFNLYYRGGHMHVHDDLVHECLHIWLKLQVGVGVVQEVKVSRR